MIRKGILVFKPIGRLLVVLAFGWAGSAGAIPVIVDGKEWLQPVDFVNLSWNTTAAVCNSTTGDCGPGALGAVANMDTWTWASTDDVNSLFNFFLSGDPLGPGPSQTQAPLNTFFPDFFAAGFLPTGTGNTLLGLTRETCTSGCGGSNIAWASQFAQFQTSDFVSTDTILPKSYSSQTIGAWMYRDVVATVPSPTILPLMTLGLAALGFSRRKLHS
jgi:hypothetical protein